MIHQNLEELKNLRQWVNYIRIWNDTKNAGAGGYDKPPINPYTLRDAMTNNPDTWATFDEVEANIGKTATHKDSKHKDAQGNAPTIRATVEGAGLILANGYCGIDFDHVIGSDGRIAPFALELVERLDTYTEVSPSGTGLHCLLFCGDLLEAGKAFSGQFTLDLDGNFTPEANKVYEVEVYFPTTGGRYFTVTGSAFRDRPINHAQGATLRKIFDEYTEKKKAYQAANRSSSVGTQYSAAGRAATGEDDRRMIDSALRAIDPSDLDFGEWASIMTALKVLGYSQAEADAFSCGSLCGRPNLKDDPRTNAYRWGKFNFKRGEESAAGIIINRAKAHGWTPAEAFDDEARTNYGRSLHSEEARREYGRQLHEARTNKWFTEHKGDFQKWKERRKPGTIEKDPTPKAPNTETTRSAPKVVKRLSMEDFEEWKKERRNK